MFRQVDGTFYKGWEKQALELEALTTPEEYASLRARTVDAQYTSDEVVQAIWKAVQHIVPQNRFDENRPLDVLEPSVGSGVFLDLAPQDLPIQFTGVEMDGITAAVTKSLHPNERILHSPFQKASIRSTFDVVVGNPPFGKTKLLDQLRMDLTQAAPNTHGYFFAKSIDRLRPNGIALMVTSRYLLDADRVEHRAFRVWLHRHAELLTAVRLPNTAFSDTSFTQVVTDVVVFRKREQPLDFAYESPTRRVVEEWVKERKKYIRDTEERAALPHELVYPLPEGLPSWILGSAVIGMGSDEKGVPGTAPVLGSGWYRDHPDHILGTVELGWGSGLYRAGAPIVYPDKEQFPDLGKAIAQHLTADLQPGQLDRVPYVIEEEKILEYPNIPAETMNTSPFGYFVVPESVRREALAVWVEKENEIDAQSGHVPTPNPKEDVNEAVPPLMIGMRLPDSEPDEDRLRRPQWQPASFSPVRARTSAERMAEMITIRDTLKELVALQRTEEAKKTPEMEQLRKKLRDSYKNFVKKHGYLHQPVNERLFRSDPAWALLSGLELDYEPEITRATARKLGVKPRKAQAILAEIFQRRTQFPKQTIRHVDSAVDALTMSLTERGGVYPEFLQTVTGLSLPEIQQQLRMGTDEALAFITPDGRWIEREAWLSGDIQQKINWLEKHKDHSESPEAWEREIRLLQAHLPERISILDRTTHLGAYWIPEKIVQDFAEHLGGDSPNVVKNSFTQSWHVSCGNGYSNHKTDQYSLSALLRDLLNKKSILVSYKDPDTGATVVDEEATALAREKADQIKDEWKKWVYQDPERVKELEDIYNRLMNSDRPRQYNGAHLTFPGANKQITLRPHQKNAVWRAMQSKAVLFDHVVGAGKTFAAISAVMKKKEAGQVRKPLVVVPNHLVSQWAADWMLLYPDAKILVAHKDDMQKAERQRFLAKAAYNEVDAVIMAHSSFDLLPIDPEFYERYVDKEIQNAREAIENDKELAKESIKRMEKRIQSMESRIESLHAKAAEYRDSGLLNFTEVGFDLLVVDESHNYKNVPYFTGLTNVRGLGNPAGSIKAESAMIKVTQCREGGGGVIFLTGTPISNTIAEMYMLQQYLDPQSLKNKGIMSFDAWVSAFAEIEEEFAFTLTGTFKSLRTLSTFSNLPELVGMYRKYADVIAHKDIDRLLKEEKKKALPIPKIKGGSAQIVVCPMTPMQRKLIGEEVDYDPVTGEPVYEYGSILYRLDNLPKRPGPGEDNVLVIINDLRKAGLDARAFDPTYAPKEGEATGKLGIVADNVARIYEEWNEDKGTQLVYLDFSTPKKRNAKQQSELDKHIQKIVAGEAEDATDQQMQDRESSLEKLLEKYTPDEIKEAIEEYKDPDAKTFSAYDELKKLLAEKGIPEDDVAFIHDADTDEKKDELFAQVRSGKVRVMIGSTPKMGPGMNVQERLVAVHHIDAPYRPTDVEQRNGRILRQGNLLLKKYGKKFAVDVMYYVTENSSDAGLWQILETKKKFIDMVRYFDNRTVSVVDPDVASMDPAAIKAQASGHDVLMLEVPLRNRAKRLRSLESAYWQEARSRKFDLEYVQNRLNVLQKNKEEAATYTQELSELVQALEYKPKDADEPFIPWGFLKEKRISIRAFNNFCQQACGTYSDGRVGVIGDIRIDMSSGFWDGKAILVEYSKSKDRATSTPWDRIESTAASPDDKVNWFQRFKNSLKENWNRLAYVESEITTREEKIKRLSAEAPKFDREEELETVKLQHNLAQRLMQMRFRKLDDLQNRLAAYYLAKMPKETLAMGEYGQYLTNSPEQEEESQRLAKVLYDEVVEAFSRQPVTDVALDVLEKIGGVPENVLAEARSQVVREENQATETSSVEEDEEPDEVEIVIDREEKLNEEAVFATVRERVGLQSNEVLESWFQDDAPTFAAQGFTQPAVAGQGAQVDLFADLFGEELPPPAPRVPKAAKPTKPAQGQQADSDLGSLFEQATSVATPAIAAQEPTAPVSSVTPPPAAKSEGQAIRLEDFVSAAQNAATLSGLSGPDAPAFQQIQRELLEILQTMPRTYQTDGQGDSAIAYLHYFTGNADWYITELDSDPDGQGQVQAFGLADLGMGFPELGYINIKELVQAGAELDYHFAPRSLRELQAERGVDDAPEAAPEAAAASVAPASSNLWQPVEYDHEGTSLVVDGTRPPFDENPVLLRTFSGVVEAFWVPQEGTGEDAEGFCFEDAQGNSYDLDDVRFWHPLPDTTYSVDQLPGFVPYREEKPMLIRDKDEGWVEAWFDKELGVWQALDASFTVAPESVVAFAPMPESPTPEPTAPAAGAPEPDPAAATQEAPLSDEKPVVTADSLIATARNAYRESTTKLEQALQQPFDRESLMQTIQDAAHRVDVALSNIVDHGVPVQDPLQRDLRNGVEAVAYRAALDTAVEARDLYSPRQTTMVIPESVLKIALPEQQEIWQNADNAELLNAQLSRIAQWLDATLPVSEAIRQGLDGHSGLVLRSGDGEVQWFLTGLNADGKQAYGLRLDGPDVTLGRVDFAVARMEAPLLVVGHEPGPLRADLREAGWTPEQVEYVDSPALVLYRGGPDTSIPVLQTIEEIADYERNELGNADVTVTQEALDNGWLRLPPVRSLQWLCLTEEAAREYGDVQPVLLRDPAFLLRDGDGGVLVAERSQLDALTLQQAQRQQEAVTIPEKAGLAELAQAGTTYRSAVEAIDQAGGWDAVANDPALQRSLQDQLDHLLQHRVDLVAQALQAQGWQWSGAAFSRPEDDRYKIFPNGRSAAGNLVSWGYRVTFRDGDNRDAWDLNDDLSRSSQDLAASLIQQAQPAPTQPSVDQPSHAEQGNKAALSDALSAMATLSPEQIQQLEILGPFVPERQLRGIVALLAGESGLEAAEATAQHLAQKARWISEKGITYPDGRNDNGGHPAPDDAAVQGSGATCVLAYKNETGTRQTFLTGMDDLGNLYGVRIQQSNVTAGPIHTDDFFGDTLQFRMRPTAVAGLLKEAGYTPENIRHYDPAVYAIHEPYRKAIASVVTDSLTTQAVLNATIVATRDLDAWVEDARVIRLVEQAIQGYVPEEMQRMAILENLKVATAEVAQNRYAEMVKAGLAETKAEKPAMPDLSATPLQQDMLYKIARSEYTTVNGAIPKNAQETETWADTIIETAEDKGVFTSIKNAGLVWHSGEKKDAGVGLTEAGFLLYEKIEARRSREQGPSQPPVAAQTEHKPIVVGLLGKPGAGKDTVADFLVEQDGNAIKLAFGDVLYQEVAKAYDVPVEWLKDRDIKDTPQMALARMHCLDAQVVQVLHNQESTAPLSPRFILQTLGDYRRQQNPNYLVDQVQEQAQAALQQGQSVIVADLRRPEEVQMVRDLGGVTVRVRNSKVEAALANAAEQGSIEANHALENALDGMPTDLHIHNNDTLETLRGQQIPELLTVIRALSAEDPAVTLDEYVVRHILEHAPQVRDQARANDLDHFLLGSVLGATSDAILAAIEDHTLTPPVREAAKAVLQGTEGMTDYRARIGAQIYAQSRDATMAQQETLEPAENSAATEKPEAPQETYPVVTINQVGDTVAGSFIGLSAEGKHLLLRKDDNSIVAVEHENISDWRNQRVIKLFDNDPWTSYADSLAKMQNLIQQPLLLRMEENEQGMNLGPAITLYQQDGQKRRFISRTYINSLREIKRGDAKAKSLGETLKAHYEQQNEQVDVLVQGLGTETTRVETRYKPTLYNMELSVTVESKNSAFDKREPNVVGTIRAPKLGIPWTKTVEITGRKDMGAILQAVESLKEEGIQQREALHQQEPLVETYIASYAKAADVIQQAMDRADLSEVTSNQGETYALYRRTIDPAIREGQEIIEAAADALRNVSENQQIPYWVSNQLGHTESARAHRDALNKAQDLQKEMLELSKQKLIQKGKDVLEKADENTSIEEVAVAIFNKHGIDAGNSIPRIVEYVQNKDVEKIQGAIGWNSMNDASQEIFEYMTGVKLGKTQKKRIAQIDAWAGISQEERARVQAEKEAASTARQAIKKLTDSWERLGQIRMQRGGNGQQYVLDRVNDGHTHVASYAKAVGKQYGLGIPGTEEIVFMVKSRDFTNFCKAILALDAEGAVLPTLQKAGLIEGGNIAVEAEASAELEPADPEVERLFTGDAPSEAAPPAAEDDATTEQVMPDEEEEDASLGEDADTNDYSPVDQDAKTTLPEMNLSQPEMFSPLWDMKIPATFPNENGVLPEGYTAEWGKGSKGYLGRAEIRIALDMQGRYHKSISMSGGGYAPSISGVSFATFLDAHIAARHEVMQQIRKSYDSRNAEAGFVREAPKLLEAVAQNADGDRHHIAKDHEVLSEPPYQEAFGEILEKLEGEQRLVLSWQHYNENPEPEWMVTLHRDAEEHGIVAELRPYREWDFSQPPEYAQVIDTANPDEWPNFLRQIAPRFAEEVQSALALAPYGLQEPPVWHITEPFAQTPGLPETPQWPTDINGGSLPIETPGNLGNFERFVGLRFTSGADSLALMIARDENGYIPQIGFRSGSLSSLMVPNAREKHYETFAEAYQHGRRLLNRHIRSEGMEKSEAVESAQAWLQRKSDAKEPEFFGYDAARAETLQDWREDIRQAEAFQIVKNTRFDRRLDREIDTYVVSAIVAGESRYIGGLHSLDRAKLLVNSSFALTSAKEPEVVAEEKSALRQETEKTIEMATELLKSLDEREASPSRGLGEIIAGKLSALATASRLDKMFGSDEAFGIRLIDEETGKEITSGEGMSVFPDGSDAIKCTNYAEQIKHRLEGYDVQIVGFSNEENPHCAVVQEEWHPGGHDFALLDNRWLIDPWARLVASKREQIVYDLREPEDAEAVARIYGDPSRWSLSGSSRQGQDQSRWDRTGLQGVIDAYEALEQKASGITIAEATIIPTRAGVVAVPSDPNLPVYRAGQPPDAEMSPAAAAVEQVLAFPEFQEKLTPEEREIAREILLPYAEAGFRFTQHLRISENHLQPGTHNINGNIYRPDGDTPGTSSLFAQVVREATPDNRYWRFEPRDILSERALYDDLRKLESSGVLDQLHVYNWKVATMGSFVVINKILTREDIQRHLACYGLEQIHILASVDAELRNGQKEQVLQSALGFVQDLQNRHPHTPIVLTLVGDQPVTEDWKAVLEKVASWVTVTDLSNKPDIEGLVRTHDMLLQLGEPCEWAMPYAGRTFRAESKRNLNTPLYTLEGQGFICQQASLVKEAEQAWQLRETANHAIVLEENPLADRVRPIASVTPPPPSPVSGDLFALEPAVIKPTVAEVPIPLPATENPSKGEPTRSELEAILRKGLELSVIGGDSANAVRALLASGDLDGWPVSVWSVDRKALVDANAELKSIRFYNGDPEQRQVFLLVGPWLVDPWMANFHPEIRSVLMPLDQGQEIRDRYLSSDHWQSEHGLSLPDIWQDRQPATAIRQPATAIIEDQQPPEANTPATEQPIQVTSPAVEETPPNVPETLDVTEKSVSTAPIPAEGRKMTIDWKTLAEDERLSPDLRLLLEQLAEHPELLPAVGQIWAENVTMETLTEMLVDLSAQWDREYWKTSARFLAGVLKNDASAEVDLQDGLSAKMKDATVGLPMLLFYVESAFLAWGAFSHKLNLEAVLQQIDDVPERNLVRALPVSGEPAEPQATQPAASAGNAPVATQQKAEMAPDDKVIAIGLIPLHADGTQWKAGDPQPQGWKLLAVLDDGWQIPFVFPQGVNYERALAAAQKKAASWGLSVYDFYQNPTDDPMAFTTAYDPATQKVLFGQDAVRLLEGMNQVPMMDAAPVPEATTAPETPVAPPAEATESPTSEAATPQPQTPPPPTIWTQEFPMTQELEQAVEYIDRFFPQARYVDPDKKRAWVHHAIESRDRVFGLLQPFFRNDPALLERWNTDNYLKRSIDRALQITLDNLPMIHNDLRKGMESLMMARPIHEPTLEEVRRYALQDRIKALTMQKMGMNTFDFVLNDGYRNPAWRGPNQNFKAPLVLYDPANVARIVLYRAPRLVPPSDANDVVMQAHAAATMVREILREGLPQHRVGVQMNVAYFDPAMQDVLIRDISEIAGLADALRKEADTVADMLQNGLVPERHPRVRSQVELTPEIAQQVESLSKLQVIEQEIQMQIRAEQRALSQRLGNDPESWPSIPRDVSLGSVTKEWSQHVEPAALDKLSELGIARHHVETPEYDFAAMSKALREAGIAPEQFIRDVRVDPEKVRATLTAYGVSPTEYLHARPVIHPSENHPAAADVQASWKQYWSNLSAKAAATGPADAPQQPVLSSMGPN
jgi:N12 class adenine-specific DNA methylase